MTTFINELKINLKLLSYFKLIYMSYKFVEPIGSKFQPEQIEV